MRGQAGPAGAVRAEVPAAQRHDDPGVLAVRPGRPGRPSRGAPAEAPYQILDAQFSPADKAGYIGPNILVEQGFYDERWELAVYPIARELRHAAQTSLRKHGLPLVARWLGGSGRAGWMFRYQRIELAFDPASAVISAKEFTGA